MKIVGTHMLFGQGNDLGTLPEGFTATQSKRDFVVVTSPDGTEYFYRMNPRMLLPFERNANGSRRILHGKSIPL